MRTLTWYERASSLDCPDVDAVVDTLSEGSEGRRPCKLIALARVCELTVIWSDQFRFTALAFQLRDVRN